jgi:choline kinase
MNTAVILAAGLGNRLNIESIKVPKGFIEFLAISIHVDSQMRDLNITPISV